jgi:hypothetical protein
LGHICPLAKTVLSNAPFHFGFRLPTAYSRGSLKIQNKNQTSRQAISRQPAHHQFKPAAQRFQTAFAPRNGSLKKGNRHGRPVVLIIDALALLIEWTLR